MIVGYHIIFGMYGFWLPNDPRGSWSDYVGSWDIFLYGPATKTSGTRSVAYRPHDQSLRRAAKQSLERPAVRLNGLQALAVGRGLASYVNKTGLPVWACAILPDHVHLVVGLPSMKVESLVIQLKGSATEQLREESLHPFQDQLDKQGRPHKCFARGEWKVYLAPDDVPRAITYAEKNPEKEGLPAQRWKFVTGFVQ